MKSWFKRPLTITEGIRVASQSLWSPIDFQPLSMQTKFVLSKTVSWKKWESTRSFWTSTQTVFTLASVRSKRARKLKLKTTLLLLALKKMMVFLLRKKKSRMIHLWSLWKTKLTRLIRREMMRFQLIWRNSSKSVDSWGWCNTIIQNGMLVPHAVVQRFWGHLRLLWQSFFQNSWWCCLCL